MWSLIFGTSINTKFIHWLPPLEIAVPLNHNIVFQPIHIKSADFIIQEISKIGTTLSTVNTNWKERVTSFSRICTFIANDNIFSNQDYGKFKMVS